MMSLYLCQFVLLFLPFSLNPILSICMFIFFNIYSFVLINLLTYRYNFVNNTKIRSITFQFKIAFFIIALLVIINYYQLFFGTSVNTLESKSIVVVVFQNSMTFFLWNPLNIFLTMMFSTISNSSLWDPDEYKSK